jgi:Domain of unknown function (DUF4129)
VGDGANASIRAPGEVPAGRAPRHGPLAVAERAARPRVVLAGLLAAIVIAGVAAGPGLAWHKSWQGPWHDHGDAIAVAVEIALAALLVALWVLHRVRPEPGWPAARLRTAQVPVIAAVMVAAGIYLARHLSLPQPRPRPPAPKPVPPKTPKPSPGPVSSAQVSKAVGPIVEYVLLALLTIALIAVLAVLLRRWREQRQAVDADLTPEDDEGEMLRRAAEAGRAALRAIPESRRAIIACYLAMEGSLGLAGAARGLAETPDELLARASAAGLLHGDAAARLTALFYGARFSERPVPDSARLEALTALDAILADLDQAARTRHGTENAAAATQ